MLKTLLKKQIDELIQGFFYNARSGKTRSKTSGILMIALYFLLTFGFLGTIFGLLAKSLCPTLTSAGFGWLYFVIMYIIAIVLALFGSVFSTYSSLYLSKDNDLLLSMPIPLRYILISRLSSVFIMSFFFSAIVLIPTTIVYLITTNHTPWQFFSTIILGLDIVLLVFILSVILGWVVARLSLRLKRKSFMTTIISLGAIAIYFFVYFQFINNLETFLVGSFYQNIKVEGPVKILYFIGSAADGNLLALLLVTAIILAISAIVYLVIDKTFIKIATTKSGTAKVRYKGKTAKERSLSKALLLKEFSYFTSSSNYMLNCSIGSIFTLIAAGALIIKGRPLYGALRVNLKTIDGLLCVLAMGAIALIMTNTISSASISLEGKSIWIIKSLPIAPLQVLRSKVLNHVMVTLPPALLLAICASITFKFSIIQLISLLIFTSITCFNQACFGLILNLKKPNLNWTNEITVVKQSLPVFLALFIGWLYGIAIAVSAIYFVPKIGATPSILAWLAISVIVAIIQDFWIHKKGVKLLEEL